MADRTTVPAPYGYSGGSQRVVAFDGGRRRVLAWGDDIAPDEIAPFVTEFGHAWIEPVTDTEAERAAFPPFTGEA